MESATYVWHLDLVALLEVLREGLNELLGGDVLDGGGAGGVDGGKLDLHI